jgi:enoyl-CoA hydratase/carnithine racemase
MFSLDPSWYCYLGWAGWAAMCPLLLARRGSPTSQKLSFEQLRRGAELDLAECLKMEYRMVRSGFHFRFAWL